MVIGTGLVARGFSAYETNEEFLIFAAGVSNSKSCTPDDFQRERELFISSVQKAPGKKVVYFSTCSVYDSDLQETAYVQHKLDMEALVSHCGSGHYIFRLSNLAGASDNPRTILNFFYSRIIHAEPFELWQFSERNIIDLADVFRIADHILKNNLFLNQIINIANEINYPVGYIVKCMEAFSGKKAIFSKRKKGGAFKIDTSDIVPICKSLNIGFGENYLPQLLEKYYPKK
jgi:nucleoside-diphosphate-sugar epimerase